MVPLDLLYLEALVITGPASNEFGAEHLFAAGLASYRALP